MNKKEAVAIIRSLLSSAKSPCSVSSLCKDFKNETGIDMPLFGYKNITGFLHSIPDTVKVTGMYPAQQVHLVTNEKSAHIVSLVQKQKVESGNRRKKTSLLNNKYYSRKMITDNEAQYESRNNLEYEKKLSNSFINEDEKEFVEFAQEVTVPSQESISPNISISTSSNIDNNITLPFEVVGLHEKVSPIDLNLHTRIGEYVEVCLCEINNPFDFFLHFRKNRKKLSHLMTELQSFYEQHEDMYRIPDAAVKPHQTCVALHKARLRNYSWYRSEITEILNSHQVIINLIDYGITVKTFKAKLRFLHRDFSFLPKQAVSGCLANIKPLNDYLKWSKSACERFHDLASDRDLVAGVVEINNEIPCISVALSSTKDIEIHINDTLVKEGFATFENVTQEEPSVQKSETKLSRVQTFPTGSDFSEHTDKNYSTVENSLSDPRPIFYVPKNERLKQMFYLQRSEATNEL